jgi:hypothetical protein
MSILKLIKNLFTKKSALREQCVAVYGEEFGELYDKVCLGQPIGGFKETCIFLDMIEAVRKDNQNLLEE